MSINPGLKKYMIVMSTFVCQVMKFDDLKELGSESAVKVCVPALNNCPCSSACVEFQSLKSNSLCTVGCWKIQAGGEDLRGAGRGHYLLQVQRFWWWEEVKTSGDGSV